MKKVFICPINKLINLDKRIISIGIESSLLYREISTKINDSIIYSNNNKPESLDKKALIIYNPFEININDNKTIKYLYKEIENEMMSHSINELRSVEQKLLDLLDNISINLDFEIEYNLELDIQKLLSSIGVRFNNPTSYLEKLVLYITLYKKIFKIDLIISFGLCNLLDKLEINNLKIELDYLEINLMDIIYVQKNINNDIIVDDDWCTI